MNNKIREALDQSMADVTWKEQNRQRVLHAVRQETLQTRTRRPALVIVLALVLVLFIATAVAGATNEAFNAWLYQFWPEAATKLMPVNLSCVDQGIRLEVISAVAEGNDILVTYAMEDLEGNRIDENSDTCVQIEYELCGSSSGDIAPPLYDPEEKKIIGSTMMNFESEINPSDGEMILFTNHLMQSTYSTVDMLPILKEYGGQARSAAVPEQASAFGGYLDGEYCIQFGDLEEGWTIPDSMHVLDWQNGLDIPLTDDVFLSGIGFVDSLLHVQLHYKTRNEVEQNYTSPYGEGTLSYSPYEIWAILCDADEEESLYASKKYRNCDMLPGGISHLYWEADGTGKESWEEIIFAMDSEPTDAQSFYVDIHVQNAVMGNWYVTIPLRMVKQAR